MQNMINTNPETPLPELIIEQNLIENEKLYPPVSGFWRRFFAWQIDLLALSTIGLFIGFIFSPFLMSIGPYGRLIGLLIVIPYFGIMNSKIGGGQTFGKRLLNIAIRNKHNEPIEVWRSLLRITFIIFPVLIFGWAIPPLQNVFFASSLPRIAIGFYGAIFYTMVFNRKARQGIHDMVLGTYVVHLDGNPIGSFPTTHRIHWTITSIWVGFVIIWILVNSLLDASWSTKPQIAPLIGVYNILLDDPRFFSVRLGSKTMMGDNGISSRSLVITVWHKAKLSENEREEFAKSIVKTILENTDNLIEYKGIEVMFSTGYDILIAEFSSSISVSDTINGWYSKIYPKGNPNGFIPPQLTRVYGSIPY